MTDVIFITIIILLPAISLMGLRLFTFGQGKAAGRAE